MSCGKRPLVKMWDKPREIRVIKPSRFEQNEASVKLHWKNVLRQLELSYKDEAFWDSQSEMVKELVGPKMFRRIVKIFNLRLDEKPYEPLSESMSLEPSEMFYAAMEGGEGPMGPSYSASDFDGDMYDDMDEEEDETGLRDQSELWTVSSISTNEPRKLSRSKSVLRSKSFSAKSISKSLSRVSRTRSKSISRHSRLFKSTYSMADEPASSADDLKVHVSEVTVRQGSLRRRGKNPHFDMLYCNKSETDMIKWKSKYKQKTFEVSASDEFSKKAEIMTKKIAKDFYDWWVDLGNLEFKSEIKRPEDIEDLFQVWFDEHASRGLILDPKILPCVLPSIAASVGVKKASCPSVLKRQIAFDIAAERSAAAEKRLRTKGVVRAKEQLGAAETTWQPIKIPEDLKSMACVWDEVQHLTSTKAFHQWLQKRPHLAMPPYLKSLESPGDKKQLFVVPSDYILKEKSSAASVQDLALPVSEFSLELKEVLSKLLND
ncbi:hypothetical protein KGM_211853 [Danaus plexippus plexippus]|uniref:Uncharacterized protein n=1 Tax=Danaus plexippus plexippus TaxID=278856 RepID=A0A212EME9_DANPL|nr:hypothetical protein KGM_211853 [Danaus plexippus plexippus]